MNRLTQYQWQQMDNQRLHDDLREVWALVTERPGISLRAIGKELNVTHWRTRKLVEILLKSGTLTQGNKNECGTLQAPVPLLTGPYVRDTSNNPIVKDEYEPERLPGWAAVDFTVETAGVTP